MKKKKFTNKTIAKQSYEIRNSGYSHHGANTSKKSMLAWNSQSLSPDNDINNNLNTLIQRSRDLYMGGANIATGALRTMRTNAVGSGLVLKPSIDKEFLKMSDEEAEHWKKTVIREFGYYADYTHCDRFKMHNFYELQQLAFLSAILSGDVFVLLPYKSEKNCIYDLRIQLIESDRIDTPPLLITKPYIHRGVEVDNGAVCAYYIYDQHPGSRFFNHKYKRVEVFGNRTGRRNILHLMDAERPEQTRGVPVLAPVIESLRQIGRYTHNELTAAVVSSLFTVFVKTVTPESNLGEAPIQRLTDDEDTCQLGNGLITYLNPNEDIEIAESKRPSVAFDGFINAIYKQIGSALEIPYELLIKHFSASYSASRAALLEAWKMFRMRRAWFANDFCQPIYEAWLAEAVARGRIYAPGFFDDPIMKAAYCRAEWHGPSQGQIDPLKEVNAATKRVAEGFSTRERESAELTGTDFNINHQQRLKEENMRQELLLMESNTIETL